jgi:hypothetical protein
MFSKIKNNLALVTDLLEKYPRYRGNKNRLIAHVLFNSPEVPSRIRTPELREFLELLAAGKLPNIESLERSYRKAIELNPGLAGENQESRLEAAQEIKTKIHTL